MTKISIAFLAAVSIAGSGCHKDKGGSDRTAAIARLTELKDQMCACKDKRCSDQVSAELAAWSQEQDKSEGDNPAPGGDKDREQLEALKDQTASCLLKIEVPGGTGAPGSAAAGSAAGSAAAGAAH